MSGTYTLFGSKGCGSVIVAAALELTRLPYHYQEVDYHKPSPERERLLQLNPLCQVPVLLLPDGTVMTESAAILVLLHLRWPLAGLIPSSAGGHLPAFLRWIMVINAQIYPSFTYGDKPEKWLPGASNAQLLTESTDGLRKKLWLQIEAEANATGPWFFGETFTALDIYIAVMHHWRPGPVWFAEYAPRLEAIAKNVARHPRLEALFKAHFG